MNVKDLQLFLFLKTNKQSQNLLKFFKKYLQLLKYDVNCVLFL